MERRRHSGAEPTFWSPAGQESEAGERFESFVEVLEWLVPVGRMTAYRQ
jgi:hypothetical protein